MLHSGETTPYVFLFAYRRPCIFLVILVNLRETHTLYILGPDPLENKAEPLAITCCQMARPLCQFLP